MIKQNFLKYRLVIFGFLTLMSITGKAQYVSVDSLKGFMCYKFGDITVPENAEIVKSETNGKFIIYHVDTSNFCGLKSDAVTLSYYEGKLYQVFLDIVGEKESMSLLNIFTTAFGPCNKLEVVSTEYDIRAYWWFGNKVEIKYSTDATYTGGKIIIYDKTVKDKMTNLFNKNKELDKDEKKILEKILGK